MKNNISTRPMIVWILIYLQAFLGLNGLAGGGAFLLAPDGHLLQMPMYQLDKTPFSDFLIPGALLFTFVGVFPIAVAYSLWKRPAWSWPNILNPYKQTHWSWAGSLAAGMIAMIWIFIQIQWIQVGLLHVIVFGWGVLLVLITILPSIRQYYRLNC